MFAGSLAFAVWLNYAPDLLLSTPLAFATVVALALTMALPTRPALLGLACSLYGIQFLVDERPHFVHTEFDFVVCMAVLLTLVGTARGPAEAWPRRFLEIFRPLGLCLAGLCLFAAGFSKLNEGWFEPALSCGALFYEWARTVPPLHWLPTGDGPWWVVMVGVVVAELVAPILLVSRRTRRLGVCLAFPLFFALATNPSARLFEFTGPFLALLLLAFDASAVAARRGQWWWWPWAVLGGMVLCTAFAGLPLVRVLAVVWMIGLLFVFLATVVVRLEAPSRIRVAHLGWVVLVVVLIREITPYLGIRAPGAFVMAGNLRITPLYSNHLVIGRPPSLPINQVAYLRSSTDPKLDTKGRLVWPTWMLFDHLARHPEQSATVGLGGASVTFEAHSADPRIRRNPWAVLFPVSRTTRREKLGTCGHHGPPSYEERVTPRRRALWRAGPTP
ncbi:MAG: hypothetical protein KTR31_16360 [Myxococcales bacterium]|nr:hypothetical protein [Myxococcales bacterium]